LNSVGWVSGSAPGLHETESTFSFYAGRVRFLTGGDDLTGAVHVFPEFSYRPECTTCRWPLTVKHILVECTDCNDTRDKYFIYLFILFIYLWI